MNDCVQSKKELIRPSRSQNRPSGKCYVSQDQAGAALEKVAPDEHSWSMRHPVGGDL
jgi:hypothetical protein